MLRKAGGARSAICIRSSRRTRTARNGRSACPGPRSALPAAHSWCWAKIKPPCRTATMQTTLLSEQPFCPSCSGTAIFWCAMPRFCIWMPAWTSAAPRPVGSMRIFSSKRRSCAFSTDAQADTIWSMIRESGNRLNIQLINLRGNNARWNEAKAAPRAAENIRIQVRLDRPVAGAFRRFAGRR